MTARRNTKAPKSEAVCAMSCMGLRKNSKTTTVETHFEKSTWEILGLFTSILLENPLSPRRFYVGYVMKCMLLRSFL